MRTELSVSGQAVGLSEGRGQKEEETTFRGKLVFLVFSWAISCGCSVSFMSGKMTVPHCCCPDTVSTPEIFPSGGATSDGVLVHSSTELGPGLVPVVAKLRPTLSPQTLTVGSSLKVPQHLARKHGAQSWVHGYLWPYLNLGLCKSRDLVLFLSSGSCNDPDATRVSDYKLA